MIVLTVNYLLASQNPTSSYFSKAIEYIQGCGISIETIKKYKLGYDTDGYNHLLKDFPQHRSNGKKRVYIKYIFPYPDLEGKI